MNYYVGLETAVKSGGSNNGAVWVIVLIAAFVVIAGFITKFRNK